MNNPAPTKTTWRTVAYAAGAFIAGCVATYLAFDVWLQPSHKDELHRQQQAQAVAEQKREALWRFNMESTLYFHALEDSCNTTANAHPQAMRWRRERQAQFEWALTELGARFQQSSNVAGALGDMRKLLNEADTPSDTATKPAGCASYKAHKQRLDQQKLLLASLAANEAYSTP